MSSNTKRLLIMVIPLLCLLASIPVCYATRYNAKPAEENTYAPFRADDEGGTYSSKLRLYQKLAWLTSRAHQNGGEVTVTQNELRRLARDFRDACP